MRSALVISENTPETPELASMLEFARANNWSIVSLCTVFNAELVQVLMDRRVQNIYFAGNEAQAFATVSAGYSFRTYFLLDLWKTKGSRDDRRDILKFLRENLVITTTTREVQRFRLI